jgi:hypothetical protein
MEKPPKSMEALAQEGALSEYRRDIMSEVTQFRTILVSSSPFSFSLSLSLSILREQETFACFFYEMTEDYKGLSVQQPSSKFFEILSPKIE